MGLSSSTSNHSTSEDGSEPVDEYLESRKFYHGLARSLEGGTPTRPGLPVELVIHILRLADCVLRLTFLSGKSCSAYADSAQTRRISWFSTPPLKRSFVLRGLEMQLVTLSRDQGWCGDPNAGSWSWFEIAITSETSGERDSTVKQRGTDGSDLVWISHYNPIASNTSNALEGAVFDKDHEIWQHLDDGDMLEVRVCAKYGAWQNNAQEGVLNITEWFEPTLPPRNLE